MLKIGSKVWLHATVHNPPDMALAPEKRITRVRLIDGQIVETNARNIVYYLPDEVRQMEVPTARDRGKVLIPEDVKTKVIEAAPKRKGQSK